MTPEAERYNSGRTVRCKSKARHRRAFAVLDPGGRIRTGIPRMDSSLLFQLSYSGVVPQVYAAPSRGASRSIDRVRDGQSGLRQRSGMSPEGFLAFRRDCDHQSRVIPLRRIREERHGLVGGKTLRRVGEAVNTQQISLHQAYRQMREAFAGQIIRAPVDLDGEAVLYEIAKRVSLFRR